MLPAKYSSWSVTDGQTDDGQSFTDFEIFQCFNVLVRVQKLVKRNNFHANTYGFLSLK